MWLLDRERIGYVLIFCSCYSANLDLSIQLHWELFHSFHSLFLPLAIVVGLGSFC